MDRLKDEYYDENEDFSEIDALLDAWSCREVDTPADLHKKIMSTLPAEDKNKSGKKYSRYLATAALAAVVLLASISLGQLAMVDNEVDSDKLRSNDTALFKQAYTDNIAEENIYNDISDTASVQAANMDMDSAIDWQKEKEAKEALLAEQEALLNEKKAKIDTAKTEEIVAWLKQCLEAIEQEDSESYEKLLKNSPLSE